MPPDHPLPRNIRKVQLNLGFQDQVKNGFPTKQSIFKVKDLSCQHTYISNVAPENSIQVWPPWLRIDFCDGCIEGLFCDGEFIIVHWKPWDRHTHPLGVRCHLVIFLPEPYEKGHDSTLSNLPEHKEMLSVRTKIKILIVCLSKSSGLFPLQARVSTACSCLYINAALMLHLTFLCPSSATNIAL